MKPEQAFGKVLRELREKSELSQEDIAFEAGLNRNYISLLELGQSSVTIDAMFRIAKALQKPPSNLLAKTEALLSKNGLSLSQKESTKKPGPKSKTRSK